MNDDAGATLYVDLDGFFAAVEETWERALWDRPVAVIAGVPGSPGGIIIAANRAAKAEGVHTGTLAREAKRRVPALAVRTQRPERYIAAQRAIAQAIETVLPIDATHSVDEVSATLGRGDQGEDLIARAKRAVATAVGPRITLSAGVAGSVWLAKTAAESAKPDGAVVWRRPNLPGAYAGVALGALPGVGPAIEGRLRAAGLDTPGALAAAGPRRVSAAWGSIEGHRVWSALQGEAVRWPRGARTSIGHARVLEPALAQWQRARPIVRWLTMCVMHRCALEGVAPARIGLEAITTRGRCVNTHAALGLAASERAGLGAISTLWDSAGTRADAPQRIGVSADRLSPWPATQHSLLEQARDPIQPLLDTVRARFGARAMTLGESLDRSAPYTGAKIAYQRVPDDDDLHWLGIEMPADTPWSGGATC